MIKISAYWKRYWHCLAFTIREIGTDHRMKTEYINNKTVHIGCCCGKNWYNK